MSLKLARSDRVRLESIIREKEALINSVEARLSQLEEEEDLALDESCNHRHIVHRVVFDQSHVPLASALPTSAPPSGRTPVQYVDLPCQLPNLQLSQSVLGPVIHRPVPYGQTFPRTQALPCTRASPHTQALPHIGGPLARYYTPNSHGVSQNVMLPTYYPPPVLISGPSYVSSETAADSHARAQSPNPSAASSFRTPQPSLGHRRLHKNRERVVDWARPVSLSKTRERPVSIRGPVRISQPVPSRVESSQYRALVIQVKRPFPSYLVDETSVSLPKELKCWNFEKIRLLSDSKYCNSRIVLKEIAIFFQLSNPGDLLFLYMHGYGSKEFGGSFLPTETASPLRHTEFNSVLIDNLGNLTGTQIIAIFDFPYSERFLGHMWALQPREIFTRTIHLHQNIQSLHGLEGELVRLDSTPESEVLCNQLANQQVASFGIHFVLRTRSEKRPSHSDNEIFKNLIEMSPWIQTRLDEVQKGTNNFPVLDFFRGFILKYIKNYYHDNFIDDENRRVPLPCLTFNSRFRPFEVNFGSHIPVDDPEEPVWNDAICDEVDLARPKLSELPEQRSWIRIKKLTFDFVLPLDYKEPEYTSRADSVGEVYFNIRKRPPICRQLEQNNFDLGKHENISIRENASAVVSVTKKSHDILSASVSAPQILLDVNDRPSQDFLVDVLWRQDADQHPFLSLGFGFLRFNADPARCTIQRSSTGAFVGVLIIEWERTG